MHQPEQKKLQKVGITDGVKTGAHRNPAILTQQAPVESDQDLPAYLTIRDAIAEEIRTGRLGPGMRLPSERALAAVHSVARMTARKALGLLEAEGAIHSSDRRGYFVSLPRIRYRPLDKLNLMRQLRQQGLMIENIYLGRQLLEANDWYANRFNVPLGTPLVLERSVVEVEGRRVVYSEDCILSDAVPGYADRPFLSPMTQNLQRNYGVFPRQIWTRIRMCNISFVASKHLGVAQDTLGFNITHVQEFEKRVVMVDRIYWLSDAVELIFDNETE